TINSIAYKTTDSKNIQIFIETSRKVGAYVRYQPSSRKVILDIVNSRLYLKDPRQRDQAIEHPLIKRLTATTVQSSTRELPLARILLDASRPVSTTVKTSSNQIILDVTDLD